MKDLLIKAMKEAELPYRISVPYVVVNAFAEAALTVIGNNWVPVDDRLPEYKRDYLCYRPSPEEYFVCTYDPERKVFAHILVIEGITHWCELPPYPKTNKTTN